MSIAPKLHRRSPLASGVKAAASKVRQENYVVTIHADEEMEDDQLSILDVESCILKGEILERQRDRATQELKYRIRGCSLDGEFMETLVKMGATGKVVIITVYII